MKNTILIVSILVVVLRCSHKSETSSDRATPPFKNNIQSDSVLIDIRDVVPNVVLKYRIDSLENCSVLHAFCSKDHGMSWELNCIDTLPYMLDTLLDCNGDKIPDLILAIHSTTGSFGGCSYLAYSYLKEKNRIDHLHSLENLNGVSFSKGNSHLSSFASSYDYEVAYTYRWVGIDSLDLIQIDSIGNPYRLNPALKNEYFCIGVHNGIRKLQHKKSDVETLSAKYKNYFGTQF